MMADLPIYDAKPWEAAYGTAITPQLPAARYTNLAHMVHSACERYAQQTAYTAVVPNGMNGSLSYAQVGELSDAFALYLREVCGLKAQRLGLSCGGIRHF
jgi:long-chain acyl-CoA synthetase